MSPIETVLVWAAIVFYGIASALYIYSIVFEKPRVLDRTVYVFVFAFLLHTAGIFARYAAIGNLPVAGDYEAGLAGAWVVTAISLYVIIRNSELKTIGVATAPFVMLMIGYGVMRNPVLVPMAASVKSIWLYLHVGFAWLAFGAYAVAFGAGVMYLLKEKHPEKEFYRDKIPDLPKLDDYMFRFIIFGFITDAVMIAAGSIWAKNLWGNYWAWDPVETWSLVTWIIYGVAIHLKVTMGWKGRRLAWITVAALCAMVITYFGLNYVVAASLHLFDAMQAK